MTMSRYFLPSPSFFRLDLASLMPAMLDALHHWTVPLSLLLVAPVLHKLPQQDRWRVKQSGWRRHQGKSRSWWGKGSKPRQELPSPEMWCPSLRVHESLRFWKKNDICFKTTFRLFQKSHPPRIYRLSSTWNQWLFLVPVQGGRQHNPPEGNI